MALDALENQELLDTLNSERFMDTAPAAVHATLLDEGRYLGSVRTMYRVLARTGGSRERRNQLVHPAYTKPELLAVPTRSGPGTSPSCVDRSSGRTFTCT
jgi:putative transposase